MKKVLLIIFFSLFLVGCSQTADTNITTEAIDLVNFEEITSIEELKNIEMNKSYILMNDLDLMGEEWVPLGTFLSPYLGKFDGNGMTISNLTILEDHQLNGLFGYIKGEVFDLNLNNFNIDYTTDRITYAGGVVGISSGKLININLFGNIIIENTFSNTYSGLLAGVVQTEDYYLQQTYVASSVIDNSASGSIDILGQEMVYAGGLIGSSYNAYVHNNKVGVNISVKAINSYLYAGGLIGNNYGEIDNGLSDKRSEYNVMIDENIVTGEINAEVIFKNAFSGGLIGFDYFGLLSDNFAGVDISNKGKMLKSGLLIGESWYSDITNVVVSGNIIYETEADQEVLLGVFAGRNIGEKEVTLGFFVSENQEFSDEKNQVSETDIVTLSWYQDNFSWDDEFINKIIDSLT